jgi:hypothetical protein
LNPEKEITRLEQTKQAIIGLESNLNQKYSQGELGLAEKNILLHEKIGPKEPEEIIRRIDKKIESLNKDLSKNKKSSNQKIKFAAAAMVLVFAILTGVIITTDSSTISGFSVHEITKTQSYGEEFIGNSTFNLEIENITSLKVNARLKGLWAKMILEINNTQYLIEEFIADPIIITDKEAYSLEEEVTISIPRDISNSTLYYDTNNDTNIITDMSFITNQIGVHKIILLGEKEGEVIREEKEIIVYNNTNEATEITLPIKDFNEVCKETCNLSLLSNPKIIIQTDELSSLILEEIIVVQRVNNQTNNETIEETNQTTENQTTDETIENKNPIQEKTIQDIDLIIGEEKTLNLSEHFSDPEGQKLLYEINELSNVQTEIVSEEISIKALKQGTEIAYIYVSDGENLILSDTFKIQIKKEEEIINQTVNISEEIEVNDTNRTVRNSTIIETNQTQNNTNYTYSCNDPDVNKRPSTCFTGIEEKAFEDLSVELKDLNQKRVGLFTRYGNLVIRGILYENSQITPKQKDFTTGYKVTEDFEERIIYTSNLETESGNLYLKGQLFQNQETLQPEQYNTLIIRNSHGLILGYFNEITGDLYLRGNIVQLGEI